MRAERIASVFDAAVGGLAICDAQHQVLEINDQLAALCGRSVNALHHISLDEVLFPDAAEAEPAWATIARTGVSSAAHPSVLQSLMRISYAVFCLQINDTPIIRTSSFL